MRFLTDVYSRVRSKGIKKGLYEDDNINYATIESGANTRTVNFSSSELYSGPYLVPVNGKKYYFWLKVTSAANNVRESAWSNVAEFTYTK